MLDSFIFSIEATFPVFAVILLGMLLRRVGIITEEYASVTDKYVFKIALPVLLFKDISGMDFKRNFDVKFILLCALVSVVMFLGSWAVSAWLLKDKDSVGAFAQGCARGSAAILGVAFVENIYGSSGMAPMMIVSAVPLFNILSVVILTFSAVDKKKIKASGLILNIITNPIIIGALAGVPFSALGVSLPNAVSSTVNSVASTATPMALLAIGASFDLASARKKIRPAAAASFVKLFVLPMLFLPVAVLLGFRDSALVSFFVMVGAPTTVTAYIMSKNMNGDYVLSSNIIMLSTLVSSLSITFWMFIMRLPGLI